MKLELQYISKHSYFDTDSSIHRRFILGHMDTSTIRHSILDTRQHVIWASACTRGTVGLAGGSVSVFVGKTARCGVAGLDLQEVGSGGCNDN
jgi:hypothetical protein